MWAELRDRIEVFLFELQLLWDVGVPWWRLLGARRAYWQLHLAHGLDYDGVQHGEFDAAAWADAYEQFLVEWSPLARKSIWRHRT
jgi:hypothetical protein